ncbi:platelet-activating factor acetylhydrolase, isoform II-domain-containing protein [Phakopsora pachyrhizi]|uniref:Putative phospholipase n=1 Tax=Phakopsora pachyrhizi TaxID=170000 RepID=A0AAV0BQT3_PHAPC|nr:platelet-activating factor acetylhydrolase, isoform II-domain-containing protein [Phakopsora pachyrhizi]
MFNLRSRAPEVSPTQSDVLPVTSSASSQTSQSTSHGKRSGNQRLEPTCRRGPWRWLDRLSCYLPQYSGNYSAVGTLTLEIPIESSREFSTPMRLKNNEPALRLCNSLMTIFYPTSERSKAGPRLQWITMPQIRGYLKFARIRSWKLLLAIPLSLLAIGRTKLPTFGAAPINQHGKKRQLILFCHGLTGNRTCYSQLCGQLAAKGYVVAAIEHRDGSGSHSVVNDRSRLAKSSFEVPCIDMEDLDDKTRPETYLIARAYQLELRTIELLEASKILGRLSEQEGWRTIKSANVRVSGSADWFGDDGSSWSDKEWCLFASSVDWNQNVIAAGHSFGGATVLACAMLQERPKNWIKLIAYDPWIETLEYWPSSAPKLLEDPELPILVVNSPGFSYWPSHFNALLSIIQKSKQAWIITVGGIIHTSFSDLPILLNKVLKLIGKLKLDSQKALELIIGATIEFVEEQPGELLSPENSKVIEPKKPEEIEPGDIVVHLKP